MAPWMIVAPATSGPKPMAARANDREQARQRINVEVRTGRRGHPNQYACVDCGHTWRPGERRHEYDHHLGYAAEHHGDVEPVCTLCHAARSVARGEVDYHRVGELGGAVKSARRATHCKLGHPMERMNDGKWRCYTCRRAYWRQRNRRKEHG